MAGTLTIHYGLMGGGKTLFAMQDAVLPAVREGRPFFTNITGIHLSAISWITGVHQSQIRYYPVENISDVIGYFDDNELSHDGLFVLDEMKDFIDDEKAVHWLESRINVCRKRGVDFLFIAQQNKKQYIHPDLVGLCDTCNVFVARKQQRDTKNVDCYYCQGGDPKIVNKIPLVYDGVSIRKKDERVFLTYETSDSKYYTGKENESYRGLLWWQTRKWKFRFAIIAVFVLMLGFVGFLIYSVFHVGNMDLGKLSNKVGKNESISQTQQQITPASGVAPLCFDYIVCDEYDCETNLGTFSAQMYSDGVLCGVGGRCARKCERTLPIPDGGGLLPFGK